MGDVARAAGGVHPSTVSLALRNDPSISEATRRKVRIAAKKVGYRPDPMLDAFNSHRKGVLPHKSVPVVAIIADFETREQMESSVPHRLILEGARIGADMLHCKLEPFFMHRNQLSPERVNSILRARGIVAVLLASLRPWSTRLAFDWDQFCVVALECPHLTVPSYSVNSDRRDAARMAFRQLHAAGHRRIGLACLAPEEQGPDERYKEGYLFERGRLKSPEELSILQAEGTLPVQELALAHWIRTERPDGLIGSHPELPAMLERLASTMRVPAYAALDATVTTRPTQGVIPDYQGLGIQAVEQVVSLMRANQRGLAQTHSSTTLPPHWKSHP